MSRGLVQLGCCKTGVRKFDQIQGGLWSPCCHDANLVLEITAANPVSISTTQVPTQSSKTKPGSCLAPASWLKHFCSRDLLQHGAMLININTLRSRIIASVLQQQQQHDGSASCSELPSLSSFCFWQDSVAECLSLTRACTIGNKLR